MSPRRRSSSQAHRHEGRQLDLFHDIPERYDDRRGRMPQASGAVPRPPFALSSGPKEAAPLYRQLRRAVTSASVCSSHLKGREETDHPERKRFASRTARNFGPCSELSRSSVASLNDSGSDFGLERETECFRAREGQTSHPPLPSQPRGPIDRTISSQVGPTRAPETGLECQWEAQGGSTTVIRVTHGTAFRTPTTSPPNMENIETENRQWTLRTESGARGDGLPNASMPPEDTQLDLFENLDSRSSQHDPNVEGHHASPQEQEIHPIRGSGAHHALVSPRSFLKPEAGRVGSKTQHIFPAGPASGDESAKGAHRCG